MKTTVPYILMFALCAIVLSACTARQEINLTPKTAPVDSFRNTDYILHRYHTGQSFSQLAQIYLGSEKWTWKIEDANPSFKAGKDTLITIPIKDRHLGGLFENGYQKVPLLCYHKFGTGGSAMSIAPVVFDRQMKYLKDNGYRVISLDDLKNFIDYKKQIPKKSVIITIDDGYKSVFNVAWPILKKYGFTATLFVYTDYVGISSKAISWDELRILKANGFLIGSHSVTHADLTVSKKDETYSKFLKRIKTELELSKKIIDKQLNQDTIYFAFPYGRHNETVINMAQTAGYKLAVTVDRGANPFFTNPFALGRDMILKKDMNSFISKLKTFSLMSLK